MTESAPRPFHFIYDCRCGLCVAFRDWLMEHAAPGQFEPVSFDDPRAPTLLTGMPDDEMRESAHVVTPDGRVLSGHAAIRLAIRVRWWGRILSPILAWSFLDPIQRFTYTWIAKNRYRLSCRARDAECSKDST